MWKVGNCIVERMITEAGKTGNYMLSPMLREFMVKLSHSDAEQSFEPTTLGNKCFKYILPLKNDIKYLLVAMETNNRKCYF
jgi:hypothetical protein